MVDPGFSKLGGGGGGGGGWGFFWGFGVFKILPFCFYEGGKKYKIL